jgi:hypothetical protein
MDSQTRWYELLAVTPQYLQLEIESAQSSVDFFIAMLYLSAVFGLACLLFGAINHLNVSVMVLSVPAFLLTFACHSLALRAIDSWGQPIHAMVNLGRNKLAESLGLKLPETIQEEKLMWGLVSNYAIQPNEEYGAALNAYRATPTRTNAPSVDQNSLAQDV